MAKGREKSNIRGERGEGREGEGGGEEGFRLSPPENTSSDQRDMAI